MRPVILTLGAALSLSACDQALIQQGAAPRPGFALVQDSTRQATGQDSVWHLSAAELDANAARVSALVNGKTIGPDRAVQVALMNNRALQAAYAELGLSGADLWETALGPIPTLNLSVTNLGEEGFARTLEATLTTSLLELATLKPRKRMAEMDFRRAQLDATGATLALAYETRRAWIEAVGAFEAAALIGAAQGTADAGSELASELGRTGAMNRADQAREHVFTAELAGERAQRKLEAQLAKERLIRLMGLWGSDINVYVPDRLPDLPGGVTARPDIERLALTHRIDLAAGRLELERIASDYRLTQATRMLSDIEIMAGAELEREDGDNDLSPVVDIEFQIPVYDTGNLNKRRGEMTYMRAANTLAQEAVNARSEARSAYAAVTGSYRVARHWQTEVLPLRREIDAEALRSYNGMLTSTFELLSDARDGLEAELSAAEAKRDYWLAEADVSAVIWGSIGGSE